MMKIWKPMIIFISRTTVGGGEGGGLNQFEQFLSGLQFEWFR